MHPPQLPFWKPRHSPQYKPHGAIRFSSNSFLSTLIISSTRTQLNHSGQQLLRQTAALACGQSVFRPEGFSPRGFAAKLLRAEAQGVCCYMTCNPSVATKFGQAPPVGSFLCHGVQCDRLNILDLCADRELNPDCRLFPLAVGCWKYRNPQEVSVWEARVIPLDHRRITLGGGFSAPLKAPASAVCLNPRSLSRTGLANLRPLS